MFKMKTHQRRDCVAVFCLASAGLLLIELIFKWRVIFSKSLILDDAFMFERAVHDRPFNDLGDFIPAFQSSNLDASTNLKIYRFLADISNDIVVMRLIYLCFFALACAVFALLVFRVTNDRAISVLTAVFSFVTPFSPIIVLFTNGSYNILYFLIFFCF